MMKPTKQDIQYWCDALKNGEYSQKDISRMDRRVKALTDIDSNGCWNWLGAKNQEGYGYIYFNNSSWRLHRLSISLFEKLDNNLIVAHSCDNPSCFNPKHLSQVTKAENNRQRSHRDRNRDQSDEKNNMSKFNPIEYQMIRFLKFAGFSSEDISYSFGRVSRSGVDSIFNRVKFKEIADLLEAVYIHEVL